MKTTLPKILFLLITVIYNSVSGQTVIDYEAWSSSACNAFSSQPVINGLTHRTQLGQPQKIAGTLNLAAEYPLSNPRGTEYAIAYNFKQGFSYTITVNAIRVNPTGSLGAYVRLRTDLVNSASATTSCSGAQSIDPSPTGNLKQSEQVTGTAWSQKNDYEFTYSSLASAQSYLLIAAIPPTNASPQTILIKKIVIEETGSADLVFSPASLTTACGTAVTQTFTVTNPNGVGNITGYDWDLGNSSNGWTYNGSPAPQFISTASSSLTLTSLCTGAGLQNVKVTVKVNNAAYKTYTSVVSSGSVSFNITGDNTICSGTSTYTPDNIPCNSSITWSVSGTLAISGSNTGTSVNVYGTGNGAGILTATVTGGCTGVMNKSIQTGTPIAPGFIDIFDPVASPEYLCPNTTYRAEATFWGASYYEFHWSLPTGWTSPDGSGNVFTTSGLQAMITFTTGSIPTTEPFTVRGINACGIGDPYTIYVSTENCSMLGYSIYPNPAADEITVSSTDKNISNTKGYEMRLYNEAGKVLRSVRSNPKVNGTKINTQDIPNGTYFLHIIDGKEVTKRQVIINH